MSSPLVFSVVRVTRSLILCVCFVDRHKLFVLLRYTVSDCHFGNFKLFFFFWPLCCLFFFDIRILITTLVSSNSSYPTRICATRSRDVCGIFFRPPQYQILVYMVISGEGYMSNKKNSLSYS